MAKKNKKKGSVINIIEGIVIAVLILLIAAMLFLYFSFSENGAAPDIFGYTIYHTQAVKMEPKIPKNTVVFGKTGELDEIKVGSAVICRIGEDTVLTRVVQLVNENGQMSYVVKYDTAPENDTFRLPAESIIARASTQSSLFGKVLSFATSTVGIMMVIIIPSFIIIVFQIIRIINVKKAQEDAYSLDELDEIMISDDDEEDAHDFFEEPASFTTPLPAPEPPKPVERSVLSVDKNGKAGLTAVRDEGTPLFSYDGYTKSGTAAEQGSSVVKTPKNPRTEKFFSEFVSQDEMNPLYEEKPQTEEAPPAFMSNVLPKSIEEAAAKSEIPEAPEAEESVTAYEPKTVREDKIVKEANNIPDKAVIPKEKLSPPKKKNNSKAIIDLMNIIDAEESKLKK